MERSLDLYADAEENFENFGQVRALFPAFAWWNQFFTLPHFVGSHVGRRQLSRQPRGRLLRRRHRGIGFSKGPWPLFHFSTTPLPWRFFQFSKKNLPFFLAVLDVQWERATRTGVRRGTHEYGIAPPGGGLLAGQAGILGAHFGLWELRRIRGDEQWAGVFRIVGWRPGAGQFDGRSALVRRHVRGAAGAGLP